MGLELTGMTPLLQVFDMPTSLAFYRDLLGFSRAGASGDGDEVDWVLLERDGIQLMLNTAYERDHRPPQPERQRVAAHDDTALFFGCPDLDAAYEYLRAQGQDAAPPVVAPYGMRQLWLRDPDGYAVWLQWPAE